MKEKNKSIVEATLFAAGRAVTVKELMMVTEAEENEVIESLNKLKSDYNKNDRGIELIRVNDSYQLCTKKELYESVRPILDKKVSPNLSNAALEILSIIAYNPNVTRAELDSIRGVNCDGTVYKLLEYGLIKETGKLDAPGRPTTYSTSDKFLKMFGIEKLEDLPELPKYKIDKNGQIVLDEKEENI